MEFNLSTSNLIILGAEFAVFLTLLFLAGLILRSLLSAIGSAAFLQRAQGGIRFVQKKLTLLLILGGILGTLGILGFNLYLMSRNESLLIYFIRLWRQLPPDLGVRWGIAAAQTVGILIGVAVVLRGCHRLLDYLCQKAKDFEGIRANNESLDSLFLGLKKTLSRCAWLAFAAGTALLFDLGGVAAVAFTLLRIALIIGVGMLCWRALDAVIASLDALSKKYSNPNNLLRYYDKLTQLVPLLRRTLEYVIYLTVATLVVLQIDWLAGMAEWGPRLIRVVGACFVSRVIVEIANLLVEEILITRATLTTEQRQRRLTIVPLIRSILKYVVYFGAGIYIIQELGWDPTPVLAGAGILGLAVGLGAQNLINDVVSGFFILFENYYLVGDFIRTNDSEGVVEAIDLRTTRIRANDGSLHIVRNGQIGDVINDSKNYTYAVVDVGVAYESELDHVYATLETVGKSLVSANSDVLAATEVRGLEVFGESELTIRTATKVRPGRHLSVQRALRKAIKEAFDNAGIEIPYARRVLLFKDESGDDLTLDQVGAAAS